MTLDDRVKKISSVLDSLEKELAKHDADIKAQENSNISYIKKAHRSTPRKNTKYRNHE